MALHDDTIPLRPPVRDGDRHVLTQLLARIAVRVARRPASTRDRSQK